MRLTTIECWNCDGTTNFANYKNPECQVCSGKGEIDFGITVLVGIIAVSILVTLGACAFVLVYM